MICVLYSFERGSELEYKLNTSPKNYKTEIKVLGNPRLAYPGFEQPGAVY